MTDDVRDAYDSKAELYADFALGDLDRVPSDRDWLAAFAELAGPRDGAVADREGAGASSCARARCT